MQLSRYVIYKGYEGWDTVREAHRAAEAAIQPGRTVATIDLSLTDPIHLDRASLETVGRRMAARVVDGPGPALVSAKWDAPGRLRLRFSKRLSVPGNGRRIYGFDLSQPSVFHAVQEAGSGDILLSVVKAGEEEAEQELYYCRGLNPVCELVDAGGQALAAFGPVRLERGTIVAASIRLKMSLSPNAGGLGVVRQSAIVSGAPPALVEQRLAHSAGAPEPGRADIWSSRHSMKNRSWCGCV